MDLLHSLNLNNVNDLLKLLRAHATFSKGTLGFKFCTARRVLTLSLENEGLEKAKYRLDAIREMGTLRPTLVKRLDIWMRDLPASTSFSLFAMSGERYHQHYEREIARLKNEPEIIRNTVRMQPLFFVWSFVLVFFSMGVFR